MTKRAFYFDLIERTTWTAAQAFVGTWIGDAILPFGELTTEARFSIAFGAAVFAAGKCFIASKLPWTADNSASTLPAEVDPPAGG